MSQDWLQMVAVRIAGIKVGRVESISLDGKRAKVSMLIFSGYQVPTDSLATIKSLGLLKISM